MATTVLGFSYGSLFGAMPAMVIDWFGLGERVIQNYYSYYRRRGIQYAHLQRCVLLDSLCFPSIAPLFAHLLPRLSWTTSDPPIIDNF